MSKPLISDSFARIMTVSREAHESIRSQLDCFVNDQVREEIIIDTSLLDPDLDALPVLHQALGTSEESLPLYNTGYLVIVC